MNLDRVAVVGAAGKMGSGISLLLAQALPANGRLILVDPNEAGLLPLRQYLRSQLVKHAEKSINQLRKECANNPKLVSNEEVIQDYAQNKMDRIETSVDIGSTKGCNLIFEAATEDVPLKIDLFKKLKDLSPNAYFFTNTSSIPIAVLNEGADLQGRIIGYHFYNPPAIQKLLEIIPLKKDELDTFSRDLAKKLGKIVVYSHDVAGFIGNGHFIREVRLAHDLTKEYSPEMIDKVTREYLLRPMGIFQLTQYVGLDVCKHIAEVMTKYTHGEDFRAPLPEQKFTDEAVAWKTLQKDPQKNEKILEHFKKLAQEDSPEAKLALRFLRESAKFSELLVDKKVAHSLEDVNTVLKNGFYHLYGPSEVLHAIS